MLTKAFSKPNQKEMLTKTFALATKNIFPGLYPGIDVSLKKKKELSYTRPFPFVCPCPKKKNG